MRLATPIALLAFFVLTAALASCGAPQPSPSQGLASGPITSTDPNRAPITLPSPTGEQLRVRQPDGSVKIGAWSARVEPGVTYVYVAFTHCGFTKETFDFDGSFWKVVGVGGDGQGNPPPGIGNPEDRGTIVLSGPNRAVFTSQSGILVPMDRVAGSVITFGCD